jgi:hypothetical protein
MKKETLTALIAMTLLSGCVPYPVYKTLQPAAQIVVRDEANRPLPNAEVALLASAYPYGFERSRETKETTDQGTVSFALKREWRVETLMIHGAQEFFWNWCVRKDGYATYLTTDRSEDGFQSNLVVRLERGKSTACPKPSR